MASPIEALQAAGFNDDEVATWATERRGMLTNAGFAENEIDAYFTGGVKAPEAIPEAMSARITAGAEAQKREGGILQSVPQFASMMATPEGRGKMWEAVAKYPTEFMKSLNETLSTPTAAKEGTIDLTSEEGIDRAIGLGMLIAFGRLSKTTLTGKTSGLSVQLGEQVSRIDRGPTGEIVETPIGGLAKAEDFPNAARVVTEGDASMPVQEKLLQAYEEQGRHPAEVAHDAARDPVVAQRLLSKDPKDLPYGQPEQPRLRGGYDDTRGKGGIYHGSKGPIEGFSEGHYGSSVNYYGAQGFYTTDALDVAHGYANRKGSVEPTMYEVKEIKPNKVYDMEAEITPEVRAKIDEIVGDSYSGAAEMAGIAIDENPKNLREFFDAVREQAASDRIPADEIQEGVFHPIMDHLAERGFDGMSHRGGLKTKTPEHKVTIYFDPAKSIKLQKLSEEKLASMKAPGGSKPPPEPPGEPPKPNEQPSYSEAQAKVLDRISVGEADAKRPYSFDRLYTEAIDDLHPIQKVSEDAYQMARLTRGQFGKAEVFLEQGTFDFNTYKTNGAPLAEILKPVRDDLNGLRAYMTSKRAIDLEASGRKSGVDLAAAKQVVAEGGQYEKIAADLVGYQERVLQYLKDSGVLSDEAHAAMLEANKNYVPFYRVMGDEAGGGPGKSLGPVNPIKRLKGSTREIIDPIESIIKNTYAYVSIAERNQAGIALIDALKAQGEKIKTVKAPKAEPELIEHLAEQGVTDPGKVAEFVQAATPPDGTTIRAYRNGVREEVQVNDSELVRAFQGLDAQSTGLLTKIFSVPARTLRAGAVLAPDFIARNLIRDFMTAVVNSKGLFTPIDTAKGLVSVIRRDADFQNWLKAGGANSTMVALDRAYLQESLTKLAGETGLMERSWNVVKSPLTGLRMLSEMIENATRLGEFKKALDGETSKAAMQDAAFASREVTLDFARMGAKMRAYNMVTAFANAQIQGVDRIVRAFGDRPVNTTLKVAGSITMPSILLWWANRGDKRVEELPHWQKDLFWIIATDKWQPIDPVDAASKPDYLVRTVNGKTEFNNGSIWRIPKPFELGVIFGSGVERVLDQTVGKNPEAFDNFSKSVVQVLTPNFVPTAVQPMIEQWANRSSFTDRTLIPADMEKHLPEYQYTPYTTQLSRKLGQIVSSFPGMHDAATDPGSPAGPAARALSSPILIENYIRSWTGGMGMYALSAADAALRKAGVLPDPVTPTPTLADIPFVKAFAVRYPSSGSQSIQDFYDEQEKSKRFFDTYMARAKEGDVDAMNRIAEAGGPQMYARLDAIKETLSEHSKLIRDIYKNPKMPADEKRQLIDGLYYSMIQIGRAGRDMQRAVKRAPEPAAP